LCNFICVIFIFIDSFKTLSTDIDDIIPYTFLDGGLNDKKFDFGSRGRQNLQNIINLPMKNFRVGMKR
jgi:hypothetical protein